MSTGDGRNSVPKPGATEVVPLQPDAQQRLLVAARQLEDAAARGDVAGAVAIARSVAFADEVIAGTWEEAERLPNGSGKVNEGRRVS